MAAVSGEPKIAAVFASFNRREVALEAVGRLRAQTRPPDLVVVADNDSQDGSADALEALGWESLRVLRTGGNFGNAGAVRRAMDHAFELGAEAVWILDDDSWPRPGALAAMLADGWDDSLVLHPLQIDPATGRFTWPLQVVGADGGVSVISDERELPPGARVPSRGVWTGALVPRRVRETIGPVEEGLFIRGEDEEYPWRIERAGFREAAVRAAVMDHPGPQDLVEWRFLGRRLYLERGLSDWKLYYKVRNMVWLKRRQAGVAAALAMAGAYAAALLRFEGTGPMRTWMEAVAHGLEGRLGPRDKNATKRTPRVDPETER